MSLVVELSPDKEALLAAQARAARVPTERYLAELIERALAAHQRRTAELLEQHLDAIAASIPPETTSDAMESALEEALADVRPRRDWRE